ncbi:MAG: N-6 DNA methylase [Polyangiaceae bacterium]|nr:N-6 DNA methylase [Polyangiaceae bacterium]
MAQPSEGLVVSVPVLVDAQCAEKHPREAHLAFLECLVEDRQTLRVSDLPELFATVLDLGPERFDEGEALPNDLHLFVVEGKQLLRPTRALKRRPAVNEAPSADDTTPAALAGRPYAMLIWEIPPEIEALDKPEAVTGAWEYPAQAKFERLLRECRVPIGLLSNGREMRLVYAPHGESSGWLAFRVADMASVSGRPIFDAFVMLLSRERWFGVAPDQQLPAILAESRKRNADVTNELSRQVFEALESLLAGFSAADERDGTGALRAALERGDDHLYSGLLTVLLRLVFLLYCEDRGLLPTDHPLFEENYSLLGLFDSLQADYGKYPDTMHRRFGAYPRLVALFRAVFLGVAHKDLVIPARRGKLFDPNGFPFLEGWGPEGSAPILQPEARASVKLPSVDDRTIYAVLEKLLYLGGQRLSYKALDVEQIGSVYEALMGFAVKRIEGGAIRIKLGSKKGSARVWLEAEGILNVAAGQRARWLEDEFGFDKAAAGKIAEAVKGAKNAEEALSALEGLSGRNPERAGAGTLVIQPGPERRRTSSHYTPRELTEPIVARTLDPLILAMGESPSSESLLNLVICDPAVGSGAFLVAACRYLADRVVAAWTREGRIEVIASGHEDVVNHARRLVAQRCLYGVDKNTYAVQLARLSLWLVTMARNEPFTFVDHAIRHGDSLVGLNFEQVRGFHWKPKAQVELSAQLLSEALAEAVDIRKRILDLAADGTYAAQREKELLLLDAEDALDRVRLIGDLVIGAFFGQKSDKDREAERKRRLDLVDHWLAAEKRKDYAKARSILEALREMQADLRRDQVPFHWMLEFPEVFYNERPDPLEGNKATGTAFVDAFVGNPPFAGKNGISSTGGEAYLPWLLSLHEGSHGNADLSAHFFRRAGAMIGRHGTIGLIATNTIGQGDTRSTGLQYLVNQQFFIYGATPNLSWPGDAAVTVSVVHLAKGAITRHAPAFLEGKAVPAINSGLRAGAERADAVRLSANAECSFQGSVVLGMGFTLTPEEREALVARSKQNEKRIFPYIGGEEVNTSPTQAFHRYVINFGQMDLAEAENWLDLMGIVRKTVKPDRDKNNRDNYRLRWWQFAEGRPGLYAAIAPLSRCMVTARVSKHLMLSFQPADRIFSDQLYVFPLECHTAFATLQSRIHEFWARLLSSSMKTDLRYAASDCFETFPFPKPDPRAVIPELETIGETLYKMRAQFMIDTNQGLTKTYNALKDPDNDDPRVLELRALHEQMDRAVLAAYGWTDIPVPPYCSKTDADRAALKTFEDQVIDRLFVLNAERAAQETPKTQTSSAPAKTPRKTPPNKTPRGPKKPPRAAQTLPGFGGDDDS